MTVVENLMAGGHKLTRSGVLENMLSLPRARRDLRSLRAQAEVLAERFGLNRLCEAPAGTLTSGQRRVLELARAYACQPRVLLLDEPSSGLNDEEVRQLGRSIAALNAEGITLLLVSHDMKLMNVASVVNVLYFGEIIASGTMAEMQQHPRVREVYLGA
jgi:branched-chain amino acid transport system ATP-binding protein/nonpolar-amino-acid-transporting ATPase